ncbi:hypothetical protein [Niallia nealsonii]|uniref:Uncharacterized protein n=1 Tax=Niallia nealsonii TaxID=115979 RepID=A0A2N0YY00_9BACI|nr:hypothetical protein [Niallia nealsonii]PKG22130.1 hypothetical protein CWS01_18475 [Niallia nealsonii]
MTLSYKLINEAISDAKGFKEETMMFHTVSFYADVVQPKGLFVPFYDNSSGSLQEAIANGAIGAIWEAGKGIPSYTPNHFPIFYTKDIKKGLIKMIELMRENVQTQSSVHTKFIYKKETSLNTVLETYDVSVMAKWLENEPEQKGGE